MKSVARVCTFASLASAVSLRGPTKDEWKADQADKAAKKDAKAADDAKMAAVNKVVDMMTDLHTKVTKEGEDEAATYLEFKRFCDDKSLEKNNAISAGTDKKESLEAAIDAGETRQKELEDKIAELLADLDASDKAQKDAKAERKETLNKYNGEAADLQSALDSLEKAIKTLKASAKPSLMQVQALQTTIRHAVNMADALGMETQHVKSMVLLQQAPDVPMENYKFHSNEIIEMLEKLEKDFRQTKINVDEVETKSIHDFDMLMQKETDITNDLNHQLDKARKNKEKTIAKLAADNEDLVNTNKILADDKEYLASLTKMCDDKKTTYDQRVEVRTDELSALQAAIDIVKGQVSEKTSSSTIRFVQKAVRARLVDAAATSPTAMEAIEAEAEAADAPSFLQISSDEPRSIVAALLKADGEKIHSQMLTALASRITASSDPFKKIKGLIKDMIDRLLKEAADEAGQKAFCDKATKDANQKRDYAADEVKALNSEQATLEAKRDKLDDELNVLHEEITTLKADMSAADKERQEEAAEAKVAMTEAKAGLDAINTAIDILDKFYKTAAKESVELGLMQGPFEDAPDAGFDNGEAYTGAGGASGGIIGMMEVIKSDFERTISETTSSEKKAEKDHFEFMTESQTSVSKKEMAHKIKTTQLSDTHDHLSQAKASFRANLAQMHQAIEELAELRPQCVDTGMSYEERVARREDEIESLKKADCILVAYQEYGPDGLADAC